jgi:hypothetical protein
MAWQSAGFGGDVGEEVLEAVAVLVGDCYGDAHTQAGLDAFDEAVDLYGHFDADACGEAGADPERVSGLYKHSVGADIARAGAEEG